MGDLIEMIHDPRPACRAGVGPEHGADSADPVPLGLVADMDADFPKLSCTVRVALYDSPYVNAVVRV